MLGTQRMKKNQQMKKTKTTVTTMTVEKELRMRKK